MGTVITGAALAGIVCLIIRSMLRDRRQGKTECGGDCSRCRGCR